MRRFLVVGCGGSGGKTLAYLMDQLRSDLAAHDVPALPRGWKFVHLDVPSESEAGPPGLDNVQRQGGTYYGTGAGGAGYRVLDAAVSKRFAGEERLDCIASWAPREPARVTTPISDGAGQYRAVGRMITLSRAAEIRDVLTHAWEELYTETTRQEMARLPQRVPGLGTYNDNTPIVLVVSSMAGGAGASMALDVCRLLTLVPGLSPALMGVFMVAPNIFDTLPTAGRTGVRPNALAMLGEIVASQTGSAAESDMAALRALGLDAGAGVAIPFARVFPVGRFVGADHIRFGDGRPETVYRGLGRGLAGLIMSGTAADQFVSYDLGNTASPNGDKDLLGWASDWEPLPWGSYGFASLSMGRDRYAEYAAQRLARTCVSRLLEGHLQRGVSAGGDEQVNNLVEAYWPGACERIRLPLTAADVGSWLTGTAFPWAEADAAAVGVVQGRLRPFVPRAEGQQSEHWIGQVRGAVPRQETVVRDACREQAEAWAHRWHGELLARVEDDVREGVARLGLPYAKAIVERLGRHVRDVLAPQAEQLTVYGHTDVTAVPESLQPQLARLRGREIRGGAQLEAQLLTGYRDQARTQIYAQVAEHARAVLLSLADEVLRPMADALAEAHDGLEKAAAADAVDVGLARLATDHPSAWPRDDDQAVPSRFDHADNEVLLTSSAHFQRQFEADVQAAVTEVPDAYRERYGEIVRQIIAGNWRSHGAEPAPLNLLRQTASWRSRVFRKDLTTGQPIIPAPAEYDAHLRPRELLDRARRFVGRPEESFQRFCRLSIRDYVEGRGQPESVRNQREQEVVEKFRTALNLARPLISVDGTALQTVHGASVQYRYKFSDVPFKGRSTAAKLLDVLSRNSMIDIPSRSNLENAISDTDGVMKIDIFGSYPNYSPLVFDAVLRPVAEQWAEVGEHNREPFWQWRRSRPLPAALPMGPDERRAMIAGWFLGQVVGRISLPNDAKKDPVRIFDAAAGRWLDFPHPLLTPPSRFLAPYDWLPAVLESVLVAIARSLQPPVMHSLKPYQALRELYDDTTQNQQNAAGGMNILAARSVVREWLAGRTGPPGPSRAPGADAATTVDARADAAIAWLERIQTLVRDDYLSKESGGRPNGKFVVLAHRTQASHTPMFRDLAVDVDSVVGELIGILREERVTAQRPTPEPDPVIVPADSAHRYRPPVLGEDSQF